MLYIVIVPCLPNYFDTKLQLIIQNFDLGCFIDCLHTSDVFKNCSKEAFSNCLHENSFLKVGKLMIFSAKKPNKLKNLIGRKNQIPLRLRSC